MSAVVCVGVVRGYGSTPVLRRLDLRVGPGEHVAIGGPNGSGKTTLLGVLAGLLRPEDGTVAVLGGSPSDPRTRRRVGVLGHQPQIYPRLSGTENVRFWSSVYRSRRGFDRGLALLDRLGLDARDRRPVEAYSQGMRRRAALACALAHDPDLLLLDEPFAALDAHGAAVVSDVLGSHAGSIVMATHDLDRAAAIGARVLSLVEGRLREGISA